MNIFIYIERINGYFKIFFKFLIYKTCIKSEHSTILMFEDRYFYFIHTIRVNNSYFFNKFSFIQIFESYGKLGLSHYILQSIIGIWFIYGWGLEMYRCSLTYRLIICFSLCIIGLYLSKIYLKILKYGPFEWTWRCFTSFHIFSILVNKK